MMLVDSLGVAELDQHHFDGEKKRSAQLNRTFNAQGGELSETAVMLM